MSGINITTEVLENPEQFTRYWPESVNFNFFNYKYYKLLQSFLNYMKLNGWTVIIDGEFDFEVNTPVLIKIDKIVTKNNDITDKVDWEIIGGNHEFKKLESKK